MPWLQPKEGNSSPAGGSRPPLVLNTFKPDAVAKPSGADKFFTGVDKAIPNTIHETEDIVKDPFNLDQGFHPMKVLSTMWDTYKGAIENEAENFKNLGGDIKDLFAGEGNASKLAGDALKSIAGGAGVFFAPVSAVFEGAKEVPVLGTVSKAITFPFLVAGEAAPLVSNKIIDELPIAQHAKDNLKGGVGEIFALAAQLLVGKVSILDTALPKLQEKFGKADAKTIIDQSIQLAKDKLNHIADEAPAKAGTQPSPFEAFKGMEQPKTNIDPKTGQLIKPEVKPLETYKPLAKEEISALKKQGFDADMIKRIEIQRKSQFEQAQEKIVAENTKIEKAKVEETVKANLEQEVKKFDTAEAFAENQLKKAPLEKSDFEGTKESLMKFYEETKAKELPKTETPAVEAAKPAEIAAEGKPVEKVTETVKDPLKPFGSGEEKVSRVSERLGGKEDALKYKAGEEHVQRKIAKETTEANYEEAVRMAKGEVPLPEGVQPGFMLAEVERHAIERGDYKTIAELAKSDLSLQGTAAGQIVQSFSALDPESAVAAVKDITKSRSEIAEKQGDKAPKVSKSKIEQFIKGLECA